MMRRTAELMGGLSDGISRALVTGGPKVLSLPSPTVTCPPWHHRGFSSRVIAALPRPAFSLDFMGIKRRVSSHFGSTRAMPCACMGMRVMVHAVPANRWHFLRRSSCFDVGEPGHGSRTLGRPLCCENNSSGDLPNRDLPEGGMGGWE